jgi:hypothetical protein
MQGEIESVIGMKMWKFILQEMADIWKIDCRIMVDTPNILIWTLKFRGLITERPPRP